MTAGGHVDRTDEKANVLGGAFSKDGKRGH
jgi:hypothetical protein